MAPTPETLKVYVKDQLNQPIVGVLVRVFDAAGAVFVAQNYTTLVSGRAVADFTVDGDSPPISYTIRLSKTGVAFDGALGDASKSPQLITVYSPPALAPNGTNYFEVVGQTFVIPVATDPRLCRASGFFKNPSGQPLPGLDIVFINEFKPAIVDGFGVLSSKVDLRTDKDGYMVLDLYRNGLYYAMIQNMETTDPNDESAIMYECKLIVPDRSSINLLDLLFPVIKEITWDPPSISLAVGQTLDVHPTVMCSDYRTLAGAAPEDVVYDTDDHAVATVGALADRITIYGVAPGTAELTAVRKDQSVVFIPWAGIVGQPLTITVA